MSEEKKLDVSRLAKSNFTEESFPAKMDRDFRVAFDDRVYERILEHADKDKSVEIGGILVGDWKRDDDGPYVYVSAVIACDKATSKTGEVTFTHETWADVSEEMDSTYKDLRIIGWYHSHPGFGIFLSDRDMFIQNHFFDDAGQIALVVDPVAETEGVFIWRDGDAKMEDMFWVGDGIRTAPPAGATFGKDVGPEDPTAEKAAAEELKLPSLSGFTLSLMGILLLVLGWGFGGMQTRWERQKIMEGAVAHYGNYKVLRKGLDQRVLEMNHWLQVLDEAGADMQANAGQTSEDEDEEGESEEEYTPEEKHDIAVRELNKQLVLIYQLYCFTPEEEAAIMRLTAERTAAVVEPDSNEPENVDEEDEDHEESAEVEDEDETDDPTVTTPEPEDDEPTTTEDATENLEVSTEDTSANEETSSDDATEVIPESDTTAAETTEDPDVGADIAEETEDES